MNDKEAPAGQMRTAEGNRREAPTRGEGARMNAKGEAEASPEERRRVLRERARALARQPEREAEDASLDVVVFRVADETYAVESAYVREVYPLAELTPLPCTPPFVLGIVNVRGRMLSVVDIKKFFELPEKGITDLNRVVILESERMAFGVLADAVLGARRLPVRGLQPTLPTLTDIREAYLKGVTEDRLVVLDAEKLLSDRKLVVHEEVEV